MNTFQKIFCDNPQCAEFPSKGAQSAKCSSKYLEKVCLRDDEWTGGLIEINNGTHKILKTQCCSYDGLRAGSRYKDVLLEANDGYTGGVVQTDSTPSAFDVVKEIRKTVTSENKVQYLITVYRMPCTGSSSEDGYIRVKSRVRRRMSSTPAYEDDESNDYSTSRRRYRRVGRNRKRHQTRRPLYRRQYEYEDSYDYDYPLAPRRRYQSRYDGEDRLWPVAYPSSQRRRVYGVDMYDTEDSLQYPPTYDTRQTTQFIETATARGYSRALAAKLAREAADYEPAPLAAQSSDTAYVPSQQMPLESVNVAPYDNSYGGSAPAASQPLNVQQPQMDGPQGPPVYSTMQNSGQQYGQAPASFSNAVFPAMPSPPTPCTNPMGCGPGPVGPAPSSYPIAPPAPTYNSYPTAPAYPAYQPAYQPSYQPAYQPAYQPSYSYPSYGYPSSYGGLNGLFTKMQCFSKNSEVETPSGKKRISELEIGDLVLSIDGNMVQFSPVIMFMHKLDDELAEFNRITLENGDFIELTDKHLIYVSDCEQEELSLIQSKDVKINQCLHSLSSGTQLERQLVKNITRISGVGIYAPLTSSGDLFVNGILSSCHSNLGLKTLQQTFWTLHKKVQTLMGWHTDHQREEIVQLPFGVAYLTSVLDLFLPKQFF
ncbi:unnamed protein product, partial [Mesorhabditis belari]|uniref:Uncharacterized protein n=1 Tax=Mesorhabditis belari TaxID=2138241 RepID=A0AAF3EPK9_9BILA